MEFKVDYFEAQATLEKAQKIANRTKKKGLSGGWTVALETRTEQSELGISTDYIYLVVTGTPASYQGWEFIGVADFLEGEIITRTIAGAQDFNVVENYCAHCHTNRDRNSLLIVKSIETGEVKQLGTTCVKDFLGWDFSPVALPTEEEFEALAPSGASGTPAVEIVTFLAWVIATANAYGFATASAGFRSTGQLVWNGLGGDKASLEALVEPTDADKAQALELLEWGKAEFTINELDAHTEFVWNMSQALKLGSVYAQTKGIVASLFKVYQNSLTKALEDKKVYKSEQYAETGAKVELQVYVTDAFAIYGAYGQSTLYKFISEDYKLKWFCSSVDVLLEVGKSYKLKGTIKGSDKYNGNLETLLTRCKVVE